MNYINQFYTVTLSLVAQPQAQEGHIVKSEKLLSISLRQIAKLKRNAGQSESSFDSPYVILTLVVGINPSNRGKDDLETLTSPPLKPLSSLQRTSQLPPIRDRNIPGAITPPVRSTQWIFSFRKEKKKKLTPSNIAPETPQPCPNRVQTRTKNPDDKVPWQKRLTHV